MKSKFITTSQRIKNVQHFMKENQSIMIALLAIGFLLFMAKITRISSATSQSTVIERVQ